MIFKNRDDAGKQLAKLLSGETYKDPIILAIPRGGVVVGKEIAEQLNAPLDLIIPRKIGAPANPELAIGAVTQDGTILVNQELVNKFKITNEEIIEEANQIVSEIKRRLKAYKGSDTIPMIEGRTVIIVDDGIATGFTIQAALASVKGQKPKEIVLAVPVATPYIIEKFSKDVDQVFCPVTPEDFYAVGQFYDDFEQVEDEEVINILKGHKEKSTQL